jgi:ABC-type nitrate/sulfonate/bicarbonate transport system substrate-binding protein
VSLKKYAPILVACLLVVSIASAAQLTLPAAAGGNNVTLKVGYPDSLDESDVMDLYAFQILANEGIQVVPTYYDSPPLAYKALISGQQDIAYDESGGSFFTGQQTTCVGGYMLSGTFLAIVGNGITSPSQLLGKTAEDFGPGTIMRYLNYYWFKEAGIAVNTNGPDPTSVYLKNGGENVERVNDLQSGAAQEIVVDDFILADFESPAINNTAHGGPYHVLFYSPDNLFDTCYVAADSWLSNHANQGLLVKFLAALYQAQRYYISNPDMFVTFAEQQLPLTPPAEIEFASTFYPGHYTYWPYGLYNLQGNQTLQAKFATTSDFFMTAGVISSPLVNDSVEPYGMINKYFELKALEAIGPYTYPSESWVNPTFSANIQSWVPVWMTGSEGSSMSASAQIILAQLPTVVRLESSDRGSP